MLCSLVKGVVNAQCGDRNSSSFVFVYANIFGIGPRGNWPFKVIRVRPHPFVCARLPSLYKGEGSGMGF